MSQFRAKRLDIGCFVNKWVIRDHTKRKVVAEYETERFVKSHQSLLPHLIDRTHYSQSLRYVIRNTSLPPRMRAQAQLQLSQMHCYTRPTQIKNRCIMGGKGRGVLSAFRMGRVRHFHRDRLLSHSVADLCFSTVSIPNECFGGQHSGCQEGELVVPIAHGYSDCRFVEVMLVVYN
jgi:small subunit ribosomal protein S14